LNNDDGYPENVRWLNTSSRNNNILPEEILRPEDISKMLQHCYNFRDQAIIIALYESACRVGEFAALRIKHVEFDESLHCARLTIPEGKTGRRKIPLIDSVPYLRNWLNSHPLRDDPDSPLWVSLSPSVKNQKPLALGYEGIRQLINKVSRRAGIKKRTYPHLLRHSRLTELAKDLTEAELRIFAGWSGDSIMPKTYVHLSGRDIEDKILKIRGLKKGGEIKREAELEPKECPNCGEINPATAKFCNRCLSVLDLKTVLELNERRKDIDKFMNYLVEDPEFRELVEIKKREWLRECS
jgi:integrase